MAPSIMVCICISKSLLKLHPAATRRVTAITLYPLIRMRNRGYLKRFGEDLFAHILCDQ